MKTDNWPYKWFGIWKEMGPSYNSCPSIYDWIDPEEVASYGDDLPRIKNYLRKATIIVTTSAINVALPRNFYTHIKKHSFIPPDASNVNADDLDWPSSIKSIG